MGGTGLSNGLNIVLDRYGKNEVGSWYWELWNEPDAPYWKGTLQEFCKLYDYTTDAGKKGPCQQQELAVLM